MAVSFGDIDLKSGRIQPTISWKTRGEEYTDEPSSFYEEQEQQQGSLRSADCLCQQFKGGSFISKLRQQAVTRFSWVTFVKEIVYHTFFPLSIPLLLFLEGGVIGLLNRQFISTGPVAISQWVYGICFWIMNVLGAFQYNADLVVVNILWLMRSMVLATKYGFVSKSEMAVMRERVLPREVHAERTLFFAWINPIPLQVLKRQLLLAAIRKDLVDCTCALRIKPGVSQNVVSMITKQLSNDQSLLHKKSRVSATDHSPPGRRRKSCQWCVQHDCEASELEARWIQICMSRFEEDPERVHPGTSVAEELNGDVEEAVGLDKNLQTRNDSHNCRAFDLPVLTCTAYLLQQSSALLLKEKILHQIIGNPRAVWITSYILGLCHSVIPFAARAITGSPPLFGRHHWYEYSVAVTSFILDAHAMSSSIAFMFAGVADFRRRYFSAKLLNLILKNDEKKLADKKCSYDLGIPVDFEEPSSIIGWWAMRVLVQDFGRVFYMRVKYYASYFAMYCGLLLAFLVIELLSKSGGTATYLLPVVIYDFVLFTFLLALIVFPAGETNKMYHEHGATLAKKKMQLKSKLRKSVDTLSQNNKEALTYTIDFFQTVAEAVEWENTASKVTLLGFNTGKQVIGVLIGVAGVGISIAAQQFTSKVTF